MKTIAHILGPVLVLLAALDGSAAAVAPVKPPRPQFQRAVPRVEASFEPATARRGETITWKLTVELAANQYTYVAEQVDENAQAQRTRFTFPVLGDVVFVGKLQEPEYTAKAEPKADIREIRILDDRNGKLVWTHPVVVDPAAPPGETTVRVAVRMVVCSSETGQCLAPQPLDFEVPLTISDQPPVAVESQYRAQVVSRSRLAVQFGGLLASSWRGAVETLPWLYLYSAPKGQANPRSPAPKGPPPGSQDSAASSLRPPVATKTPPAIDDQTTQEYESALERIAALLGKLPGSAGSPGGERGLLAFILAGIFWGAVSLITPCVFPMIPITVSYFLKQSEKEHHRPITMAAVYCGTIIIVLTLAAVLLLSVFRMLSINPIMNIVMGLLFVFFAFSLFGWYEIELPSGLAQFTSAREGKGGLAGTVFMALTFTILSFACVAPFLGGFSGTAALGQFSLLERMLGGLAFALTFAAPFFVLALFPSLLKKLPKSGSWLNNVKVVMGFLELAAAFKFFRLSELLWTDQPTIFTFDLIMAIWVGISLLCGLYLLGVYRLPHDSPVEHLSVPRMLFSLVFLGLGFYLLPALFKGGQGEKQRPGGALYAWVDSFLLPESSEGKLPWSGNLQASIERARAEILQSRADPERVGQPKKYVFIDFTGKSCTNCSINEHTVFARPEFKELLGSYQLVQLYTDVVPNHFYAPRLRAEFKNGVSRQESDAAANLDFQIKAFGTEQLPLYAILEPQVDEKGEIKRIDVVAVYDEGKINNEAAFAEFLSAPLQPGGDLRGKTVAATPLD